jgi:hypothetical protein
MRKISNTRTFRHQEDGWTFPYSDRPAHITGATVTSWPDITYFDVAALLMRGTSSTSISASSTAGGPSTPERDTISLSDGTKISFATATGMTLPDKE